jgi:hypothetical protein
MRVLVLHPEDSPHLGPWFRQRWDLVIDLGKSSQSSASAWAAKMQCPVLRSASLCRAAEDLRLVREILSSGRGFLVDEEGIDWWDLTSLLIAPEIEELLVQRRLALEISPVGELWGTRPGWPASLLASLLRRPMHTFSDKPLARLVRRAKHHGNVFRRFSAREIRQIVLDKYDPNYQWRSWFAPAPTAVAESVVLLPSAYTNVSRMAAAYARLVPDQAFLLVATRHSGKQFESPPNVKVRDLAAYAHTEVAAQENTTIAEKWEHLRTKLCIIREFETLSHAGVFDRFPNWFRDGLRVRNAWREVIEREPVCGVLCGDDSNIYTKLPVLLAARRRIPTVDFHHGALDGRYLLKDLPCDVYLAKNEMEQDYLVRVCGMPSDKVSVGAPLPAQATFPREHDQLRKTSVILFSEPYESFGMRGEEVYRELLPPLCRLARETGHDVIIKLHPFESLPERRRMVRSCLPAEDQEVTRVVAGPLSTQLLSRAWFGLTVESTTVMDCVLNGVPCFLCGWLSFSPYGYAQQYARFEVGRILNSVDEIAEIPRRSVELGNLVAKQRKLWQVAEPEMLMRLFTSHSLPASGGISDSHEESDVQLGR